MNEHGNDSGLGRVIELTSLVKPASPPWTEHDETRVQVQKASSMNEFHPHFESLSMLIHRELMSAECREYQGRNQRSLNDPEPERGIAGLADSGRVN